MFLLGYFAVGTRIRVAWMKVYSLFAVGAFSIFNVGQVLAQNIGTLLVTRFFASLFGCAPITNVGGVVADIWDPVGAGHSLGIFFSFVFIGPVLGPIIGGVDPTVLVSRFLRVDA